MSTQVEPTLHRIVHNLHHSRKESSAKWHHLRMPVYWNVLLGCIKDLHKESNEHEH